MLFSMDPVTQKAIKKFPERASDIASSYEFRKVDAKQRLVFKLKQLQDNGTLPNPIERINIVGGWYGNILIPLLDHHIVFNEINFYEIDELAIKISKIFYPKRINIVSGVKYIKLDISKKSEFKKIKNNTLEIKSLINIRDTLLPKLISGELKITNAANLVEEAGI